MRALGLPKKQGPPPWESPLPPPHLDGSDVVIWVRPLLGVRINERIRVHHGLVA